MIKFSSQFRGNPEDHSFRTFNEWDKAGYIIRKGSKAKYVNDENIALFSSVQVYLKSKVNSHNNGFDPNDDINYDILY